MQTTVISELLQHNISFDIYRIISSEYLKCRTEGPVLRILSTDLQYNINRMYLSNVKILLRILSQYKHTVDLTAKDLFSEGAIGLKRAIELFNCELGIKFSTYASQWIKASINRAIADKDSMIRIPVNVREQSKEAEKIKKRLRAELKREPSEEEVIACMRKKPSSLSHIDTSFSYYNISNEDSDSNAANNSSFDENLIDRGIFDECDNSAIRELRDVIKNYIDGIKVPSERYYIQYHFGLNPEMEIKSKEEIISDLKIPPTEYDRIRKKVLANLKRVLGKNRSMIEANSIESGWESRSNLGY
jgi:RNA polymerase primary sigma factor